MTMMMVMMMMMVMVTQVCTLSLYRQPWAPRAVVLLTDLMRLDPSAKNKYTITNIIITITTTIITTTIIIIFRLPHSNQSNHQGSRPSPCTSLLIKSAACTAMYLYFTSLLIKLMHCTLHLVHYCRLHLVLLTAHGSNRLSAIQTLHLTLYLHLVPAILQF